MLIWKDLLTAGPISTQWFIREAAHIKQHSPAFESCSNYRTGTTVITSGVGVGFTGIVLWFTNSSSILKKEIMRTPCPIHPGNEASQNRKKQWCPSFTGLSLVNILAEGEVSIMDALGWKQFHPCYAWHILWANRHNTPKAFPSQPCPKLVYFWCRENKIFTFEKHHFCSIGAAKNIY